VEGTAGPGNRALCIWQPCARVTPAIRPASVKDNGFPWPPPGIFVFSFEFERVIQIWRENQQKTPYFISRRSGDNQVAGQGEGRDLTRTRQRSVAKAAPSPAACAHWRSRCCQQARVAASPRGPAQGEQGGGKGGKGGRGAPCVDAEGGRRGIAECAFVWACSKARLEAIEPGRHSRGANAAMSMFVARVMHFMLLRAAFPWRTPACARTHHAREHGTWLTHACTRAAVQDKPSGTTRLPIGFVPARRLRSCDLRRRGLSASADVHVMRVFWRRQAVQEHGACRQGRKHTRSPRIARACRCRRASEVNRSLKSSALCCRSIAMIGALLC